MATGGGGGAAADEGGGTGAFLGMEETGGGVGGEAMASGFATDFKLTLNGSA